jgi:hypothetical protein
VITHRKEQTMNSDSIEATAHFLHIAGALGFFIALGLEWTGLWQLRSARTPEPVRAWLGIIRSAFRVGFGSMLLIVITGVYMMATEIGPVSWLLTTVGALVMVIALTMAVTRPRMAAVGQALAAGRGPASPTWHSLANHPLLWISIQARAAVALGIILLKVAQPDWGWSLVIIGVAVVVGIASALPMPAREGARARAAD